MAQDSNRGEASIGVLITKTSPKGDQSLEENSRASIVGNWATSKRIAEISRGTRDMVIV